ncbi:beta-1 adrenergic receptor-like [Watersipora subatra]|uniref:beta-1 adrenergic receptor-like n=1 Tax=Watersipora subatra TaxID=2589382 RepID=UPI00355BC14D
MEELPSTTFNWLRQGGLNRTNTSIGGPTDNLQELAQCSSSHEELLCGMVSQSIREYSEQIDFSDMSESGWVWGGFTFFAILCLFGVIGNLLTIVMFAKYIKQTTTSVFIISLAVVDFLVCAIPMPIWLYELFDEHHGSEFFCKLGKLIYLISIPLSGSILLSMAIDRFLLIFLVKRHVVTRFRAKMVICFVALVCLIFAVPQAFSFSVYTPIDPQLVQWYCQGEIRCNTLKCLPTTKIMSIEVWYHLWQSLIISFLIMVIAFTSIYSLIFFKVYSLYKKMLKWRQSPPTHNGKVSVDHATFSTDLPQIPKAKTSPLQTRPRPITTRKKKRLPHLHTALTLFLVTIFFVIAYAPLIFMMFLGTCEDDSENRYTNVCGRNDYRQFVWHFYFLNHVTNPIVYAFMNLRFRDAIRKSFSSLKRRIC